MLALRGISKSFGAVQAVRDIDLEVNEGEFVTLLGPSGCGKTTLLRMIGGFETPTLGTITLDDVDVSQIAPELRPCNTVFQSYALFPHMDIFDNVAYGLRVAGIAESEVRERVERSLGLSDMAEKAHVNVQELSGGQQQRVALARALVIEPRVLLLDEPLGALDLKLRQRMQEELREIQGRTRTTFIYVTHDQSEALSLSHRIVVMRDGEIQQVGTPEEVYRKPKSRFVAEFVGESSFFPCRVRGGGAGDTVEVEFSTADYGGSFAYYGDQPLVPGDEAVLSIRPEDVNLVQGSADLTATVIDVVLAGPYFVYRLKLSGDQLVSAYDRASTKLAPGDEVGLEFQPGAGVVVTSAAAGVLMETRSVDGVRDALEMRRGLSGETDPELALNLLRLGALLSQRGQPVEAQPLLHEAISVARAAKDLELEAEAHRELGSAYLAAGDHAAADQPYRTSLALRREVFGEHHTKTADGMHSHALALLTTGRYDEAQAELMAR